MINGKLNLSSLQDILRKRGLEENGPVQKFIDSEVIRKCDPKVPMADGELKRSAVEKSTIGSGTVKYVTPYARYLYYGQVMGPNIPIHKAGDVVGFYSLPNQKKHLTGKSLTFSGAPERGAYWFERMKKDGGADEILRGAKELAGAR